MVLSNNDGCVIARSEEAKRIGVPMGAPAYQFHNTFRRYGVEVFSANFPLYGDMSRRVMSIPSGFSPVQEIYSIDETFLDLSGMQMDLRTYGGEMKERVRTWTGLPISVGIGPTKSLAKAANRIAKKFPEETGGVHVIDSEELHMKALRWLDVKDVWGIGRRSAAKLHRIGVKKALQFVELPESWVLQQMTITGLNLQRDLKGIRTIEFDVPEKRQSISTTRTFEQDYTTCDQVKERIVTFTALSADKLRRQNSLCRRLTIFIQSNVHNEKEAYYSRKVEVKLPFPTSSTLELVDFAVAALQSIFKNHIRYKRAGVVLHDFVDDNRYQLSLFYNSE